MTDHFCTECGAPLAPGAHFCPTCGHAADGPATTPVTAAGGTTTTGAPPPPRPNSSRNRIFLFAGIGVVLVLVAVAVVLVLGGDDQASAEVLLEPTGVEVPDPFTATTALGETPLDPTDATSTTTSATSASTAAPATSAPSTNAPSTTAPSPGAGGGVVVGAAPGLYGGTRDQGSCDPTKLVNFLAAEPDKAEAWAGVHGIDPAAIASFVDGLTPVVLRRDTRVLNHGYRDGRATARPAVLQAGTAVLVDDFGVPRVKCNCGNPLAEPRPVTTSTTYTGTPWPGFRAEDVVVVRADVRVDVFVLVDLRSGTPFRRPTGSKGDVDADAPATPSATTTTTTTTVPTASEGTAAPILFEIGNVLAVENSPTAPSVADLPAARITAIVTYHWNAAQGATPGTVALRAEDGTTYGPFPTSGSEGQGGVPNAYWTATVNVSVPAGRYTVIDSDPSTWAQNADSGGRGFVRIHGVATQPPASVPTTAAPVPPTTPDRSQEAISAVEASLCGPSPGVEDWRQYITRITATEIDFELYRVEVRIELDSGGWTALFDADFATEFGPVIRPVDDESADLLC